MARIRSIKPEFFLHEELAELPMVTRYFFAGLWCVADREGRFAWRPRRLKAEILPYDEVNVGEILDALVTGRFIRQYEVEGKQYGVVLNWHRHQIPNRDEQPSEIPAPDGTLTAYELPPNQTVRARIYARDNYACVYCHRDMRHDTRARCLDHVIPYAKGGTNSERNLVTACKPCNCKKKDRNPTEAGLTWPEGFGEGGRHTVNDSLTPPLTVCKTITDKEGEGERDQEVGMESTTREARSTDDGFERFWVAYPRKTGKDAALRAFRKRHPTRGLLEQILTALEAHKESAQWQRDGGQYIPNPATWLNQGRWQDEPQQGSNGSGRSPVALSAKALEQATEIRRKWGRCLHDPEHNEYRACLEAIARHQ